MMNWLRLFNPVFGFFGWRIIETRIGHWSVRNGVLVRNTIHWGWRFARLIDAIQLGDEATELDRFVFEHRDEINQRRATKAEARR